MTTPKLDPADRDRFRRVWADTRYGAGLATLTHFERAAVDAVAAEAYRAGLERALEIVQRRRRDLPDADAHGLLALDAVRDRIRAELSAAPAPADTQPAEVTDDDVEAGADALVRLRTQAPAVVELDDGEFWRRDARAVLTAVARRRAEAGARCRMASPAGTGSDQAAPPDLSHGPLDLAVHATVDAGIDTAWLECDRCSEIICSVDAGDSLESLILTSQQHECVEAATGSDGTAPDSAPGSPSTPQPAPAGTSGHPKPAQDDSAARAVVLAEVAEWLRSCPDVDDETAAAFDEVFEPGADPYPGIADAYHDGYRTGWSRWITPMDDDTRQRMEQTWAGGAR